MVFHLLELGNEHRGQFFTPYSTCQLMAQMLLAADPPSPDRAPITVYDPACGAGAMLIAAAEQMRTYDVNRQTQLHITAGDIDERAVHMTYVQLSLLHVPAVVDVADALTCEVRDRWYTPAHILGSWSTRALDRRPYRLDQAA